MRRGRAVSRKARLPDDVLSLVRRTLDEDHELVSSDKLRANYFRRENEHDTFDTVLTAYRRLEEDNAALTPSRPGEAALERIVHRDSCEDARRRHGLHRLRKRLFRGLVKAASFEKGLDFLCRHIDRRRVARKTIYPKITRGRIPHPTEPRIRKVAESYPDLTANEVSVCALLQECDRRFPPDLDASLFHPMSIVGMDARGILFSDSVVPERDVDPLEGGAPHQVAGVTGFDFDTYWFPLRPGIARAVHALILLRVTSTDLFVKLFDEESVHSLVRGDTMLLKHFLARRTRRGWDGAPPPSSLEELLSPRARGERPERVTARVRGKIASYLSRCFFWNRKGSRYTFEEVVRLFGLGDRLPAFVTRGEEFSGHVLFYGGRVEFIREDGLVADAVPLAGYLQSRLADDLRERASSSDRKDKVFLELFSDLMDAIDDENLSRGHAMPLDAVGEAVFAGTSILLPIQTYTSVRAHSDFSESCVSRTADTTSLERSLKFSFQEAQLFDHVLSRVPDFLLRGVRVVTKHATDPFDYDTFVRRNTIAGAYHAATRRITLLVPFDSLVAESPLEWLLDEIRPPPERRQQKAARQRLEEAIDKHYFLHTFLHEVAESVIASFPDVLAPWRQLCPPASRVPLRRRGDHFLSRYATKNQREDFCETFAVYILYGGEFRRRARRAPVLRAKYEFMKLLFSNDGTRREFEDFFSHPMEFLLGHPSSSWKEIDREKFLEELETHSRRLEQAERAQSESIVMSYEDVEDVIREHEERGEPISAEQAAEILRRSAEESADSDDPSPLRRLHLATWKATEILAKAGAAAEKLVDIHETFHIVRDGTREAALAHLKALGVKRDRRGLLDRISNLFECFDDVFRPLTEQDLPKAVSDEKARITTALCAAPESRQPRPRNAGYI